MAFDMGRSDWSDKELLEKFKEEGTKPISRDVWRQHVIYFLNSCYGKTMSEYSQYDLSNLAALVLMLPHPKTSELLFNDYLEKESFNDEVSDRMSENSKILNIPTEIRSRFGASLNHVLENGEIPSDNFKQLRASLGMLALVCLRGAGKSAGHLKFAFRTELNDMMAKFYPDIEFCKIPPPSEEYLKRLKNFSQNDFRRMLTFLVGVYTTEMKESETLRRKDVVEILYDATLRELKFNGIGKIFLLDKVSSIYGIGIGKITEHFYGHLKDKSSKEFVCVATGKRVGFRTGTNMTPIAFYKKFIDKNCGQFSWPWARLIDTTCFKSLTLKIPSLIDYVLTAIISLTEPSIWNILGSNDLSPLAKEEYTKVGRRFDELVRKQPKVDGEYDLSEIELS